MDEETIFNKRTLRRIPYSAVVEIEILVPERFNISRLLLASSRELREIHRPSSRENFRIGH